MTNERVEADDGVAVASDAPRTWQPSRQPEHRLDQPVVATAGLIVERADRGGPVAALLRFVGRPFVKLVIGLGIVILGFIAYDMAINTASWTERPEKPKAAPHHGVPARPE